MNIANTTASMPPPMDPATGASGAASGAAGAGAAGANSQLGPDSFLQLLTAQLQNQTPDNSMDPNQMMSELVSFNSLEQLMSINQILQQQFALSAASGGATIDGRGPQRGDAARPAYAPLGPGTPFAPAPTARGGATGSPAPAGAASTHSSNV